MLSNACKHPRSILFMVDIKCEELSASALPATSFDSSGLTPLKIETHSAQCLDFEFTFPPLATALSTQPSTPEVLHFSYKKAHRCQVCQKIYSRSGTLKVHMRKHTGERPYSCTHCEKRFAEKGNLHTHLRIHSGERPFQCADCGQSFTTQGHLTDHRRTHTGDRPFVCHCGEAFKRSSTLKIHQRRHTGDRPYQCPHCPKAFTESGNLRTHIRTHVHSTQTGERPFECPHSDCRKAFKTKGHLLDHLKKTKIHVKEDPLAAVFDNRAKGQSEQ